LANRTGQGHRTVARLGAWQLRMQVQGKRTKVGPNPAMELTLFLAENASSEPGSSSAQLLGLPGAYSWAESQPTFKTIKVVSRRKPRASEPALEVLAARREARYLMDKQRSVVKVGFGAK